MNKGSQRDYNSRGLSVGAGVTGDWIGWVLKYNDEISLLSTTDPFQVYKTTD